MARKTISQRIALEGGDQIQKQLKALGDEGERAFKEIQSAAEKLRGPGAQFARSMDQTIKKIRQAGEAMKDAGRKMRDLGAGMSVAVTAPVGLLGASFINAASDAQEAASAFDQLFGGQAEAVRKWAQTTAQELGRGTQAIQNQTAAFQQLFSQVQPNQDAAAGLSKQFAVLATDLASFYNMSESDALGKLMSGLSGETEPLRDFGVFLNAAAIQAKGLEMGLSGLNDELTDQEKVLATAALIMEKTTAAQGDAARTSESYANQMKRLKGLWQDLSVTMGEIILPHALKLVQALADIVKTIQGLPPPMQTLIVALSGVAAAFDPIMLIAATATIGIGGLATAFTGLAGVVAPVVTWFATLGTGAGGLAAAFGSLGPIIAGIAAALLSWPVLIAGLVASFTALAVAIYQNWDRIEARISDATSRIGEMVAGIGPAIQNGLAGIGNAITGAFAALDGAADGFIAALREGVQTAIAGFLESVSAMFAGIPNLASEAWAKLPEGLQSAGQAVKDAFAGIGDFIATQFDRLDDLASRLVDGLKAKVQSLLRAIGLAKDSASGGSSGGGSTAAFASGGRVRGPGTGTSDSILARLSNGEFVVRAAAVKHYGPQLFDLLNRLRLPRETVTPRQGAGTSRARQPAALSEAEALRAILRRLRGSGAGTRPGYASGGLVTGGGTSSVSVLRSYGTQLREVVNRIISAFASGGLVGGSPALRHYSTQMREVVNMMSGPMLMPAFASGGLVSSAPAFATGGGSRASDQPATPLSLTIGTERFDGLTAPREVAARLERHLRSADVKSAGRRPGWFREV